ncbi:MAG: hypothetical protein ABIA59_07845 [Candidatus Latescibacterota bacterium]
MLRKPSVYVALLVAAAIIVSSSPVICAERDHEDGFFLRLAGGAGPAGTEINVGSEKLKMDGTAADLEIAIGGIVTPNLAVHGTIWGWMISDPDAEANLTGFPVITGTIKGDLSVGGVGAGLTYFIMPINMYLTGSLGLGNLTLEINNISGDTDTGLIFEAAIGKEWFVSDRWAIGFAVGLTYHSFSDPDVDANWDGVSIPIRFSATMN